MSDICSRCLDLENMLKDANGREFIQLSKANQLRSERDLAMKRIEDLEEQVVDLRKSLENKG